MIIPIKKSSNYVSSQSIQSNHDSWYADRERDICVSKDRNGFGFVVVSRLEDGVYFHRVGCIIEQSPASRVDFRINDEIVQLNGKMLRKVNHDSLVKLIQSSSVLQIRTLPVVKWLVRLTKEHECVYLTNAILSVDHVLIKKP